MSYKNAIDSNGDLVINNPNQDKDVLTKINDGGTERTAIQVHGDSGIVSMPRQSYVRASLSTTATIADNTITTMVFNTESVDRLGEYDNTTGVFTATEDGVYSIDSQGTWQNIDSSPALYLYLIIKNSTTVARSQITLGSSNTTYPMVLSRCVELSAGDTIKIQVYHVNTGGSENIYGDAQVPQGTYLSITKIT